MTSSLGDLTTEVTNGLVAETQAPVTESTVMTEEANLRASASLFTKIRFSWRPEDKAILDRVRIAANTKFKEMNEALVSTIDAFFVTLWVPEAHLPDGRTVWKLDGSGNHVEDWSQLNGQDIEQTLMNLQRIKLSVAPMVNDLFLDALYAKHVASDVYDDTYTSLLDGTQNDRTARSNRESREDRYHAYFHYRIWSVANVFLNEVNQFMNRLERIRGWQTWDNKR